MCYRITGNAADALDASQEAMISVVRGLTRFDGKSSFGTWVYRIATNASLDELRRRKRRPAVGLPGSTDDRAAADGGAGALADPDAGLHIDSVADRMALEAALADLAEEFRVPVVLRDVADLEYAEIAVVLAVPVGTVKSRIARGRLALAQALNKSSEFGNQSPSTERLTDRND